MRLISVFFILVVGILTHSIEGSRYGADPDDLSLEEILDLGDTSLSQNDPVSAAKYYEHGVAKIKEDEDSLVTCLSMYTNLGTTYSSMGDERKAIGMYRNAIVLYSNQIEEIVEKSMQKTASDLTAQAAFFLGLSHDELGNHRKAADSYAFAASLDEYHWAAFANLGSVLQDHLHESSEALAAYNKASDLLTQREVEPTDPPDDPNYVVSQLQYGIGLAISFAKEQKCVMHDDPTKEVPCSEMAAAAFNYAVELDPDNEKAKHMLASVTADATMIKASNTYVTELFEDYAEK